MVRHHVVERARVLPDRVFDDAANECVPKFAEADGIIVGGPVYFGNPNGTVLSFMQCLLYSSNLDLRMKMGACVVSARRGGNSATYEALNQLFGPAGMPTTPSTYWNDVHGKTAEDVYADEEGVQTVRNMAFMMRAIADGREAYGVPERNKAAMTNFIR